MAIPPFSLTQTSAMSFNQHRTMEIVGSFVNVVIIRSECVREMFVSQGGVRHPSLTLLKVVQIINDEPNGFCLQFIFTRIDLETGGDRKTNPSYLLVEWNCEGVFLYSCSIVSPVQMKKKNEDEFFSNSRLKMKRKKESSGLSIRSTKMVLFLS